MSAKAFAGGLMLGAGLGVLVMSMLSGLGNLLLYTACGLCLVGGIAIGSVLRGKRESKVQLTGRVFSVPYGPVIVEAALRRVRAVMGERR